MDTNEYKYAYDSIGNRQPSSQGYAVPGWAQMNAQSNSYVANDLNQYTNIIEGGTPETLFYDADGNLTNANGWTFSWNGENRLIRASDGTTTVSYVYDYMGRRIRKDVVSDTRDDSSIFIYDGWNLIAELGGMASSPSKADYYVWGLDLSGSLQGAGGIGGLLAHIPSGDTNTTASAHLAFCDANGNVTDYIAIYPDGSGETNGTVVARYQYDPYGNLIEQNGPEADTLRFRFSSKYLESELETTTSDGLYYYGYRFYNPTLGRWLRRDPIGEEDQANIYVAANNDLSNLYDYLGLWREGITINDGRRRLYYSEGADDTFETLAEIVGLNPSQADKWAKAETECYDGDIPHVVSVPNIWISADLLRGGGIKDHFVSIGGSLGRFIGTDLLTFGYETVKPNTIRELIDAMVEYEGDIWGMVVFAHGSKGGVITMPGLTRENWRETKYKLWMRQTELMTLVDGNEYDLSKIYMMQCYSAYSGTLETEEGVKYTVDWETAWKERAHAEFSGYKGKNVLGVDLGWFIPPD